MLFFFTLNASKYPVKTLLLLFNIDNNNINKIIFNNKIKYFLTPKSVSAN